MRFYQFSQQSLKPFFSLPDVQLNSISTERHWAQYQHFYHPTSLQSVKTDNTPIFLFFLDSTVLKSTTINKPPFLPTLIYVSHTHINVWYNLLIWFVIFRRSWMRYSLMWLEYWLESMNLRNLKCSSILVWFQFLTLLVSHLLHASNYSAT